MPIENTEENFINYYTILGITSGADETAIRNAYRSLAKHYHPDVNPDEKTAQHFLLIQEAYEVLSDSTRRKDFDATLSNMTRRQTGIELKPDFSQQKTSATSKASLKNDSIYIFPDFKHYSLTHVILDDMTYPLTPEYILLLQRNGVVRGENSSLGKYLLMYCVVCKALFGVNETRSTRGFPAYNSPYELFPLCPHCKAVEWCPEEEERERQEKLEHEQMQTAVEKEITRDETTQAKRDEEAEIKREKEAWKKVKTKKKRTSTSLNNSTLLPWKSRLLLRRRGLILFLTFLILFGAQLLISLYLYQINHIVVSTIEQLLLYILPVLGTFLLLSIPVFEFQKSKSLQSDFEHSEESFRNICQNCKYVKNGTFYTFYYGNVTGKTYQINSTTTHYQIHEPKHVFLCNTCVFTHIMRYNFWEYRICALISLIPLFVVVFLATALVTPDQGSTQTFWPFAVLAVVYALTLWVEGEVDKRRNDSYNFIYLLKKQQKFHGSRLAITIYKPDLEQQGFDIFFTPERRDQLRG